MRIRIIIGLLLTTVLGAAWFLANKNDERSVGASDPDKSIHDAKLGNQVLGKSRSLGNVGFDQTSKTNLGGHSKRFQPAVEGEIFHQLVKDASLSGDFSYLEEYFQSASQLDKHLTFKMILGIFSPMGPTHDIAAKLQLLKKLNQPADVLASLHEKVLEAEALERYNKMKEEGLLSSLSDRDFAVVCRSITKSRISEGFAKIEDARSESAKRLAASEVARMAIAGGLMEASVEIRKLEPGIVRDEAIVELVKWLRRTSSANEAIPWVGLIQDPTSRSKVIK